MSHLDTKSAISCILLSTETETFKLNYYTLDKYMTFIEIILLLAEFGFTKYQHRIPKF